MASRNSILDIRAIETILSEAGIDETAIIIKAIETQVKRNIKQMKFQI